MAELRLRGSWEKAGTLTAIYTAVHPNGDGNRMWHEGRASPLCMASHARRRKDFLLHPAPRPTPRLSTYISLLTGAHQLSSAWPWSVMVPSLQCSKPHNFSFTRPTQLLSALPHTYSLPASSDFTDGIDITRARLFPEALLEHQRPTLRLPVNWFDDVRRQQSWQILAISKTVIRTPCPQRHPAHGSNAQAGVLSEKHQG